MATWWAEKAFQCFIPLVTAISLLGIYPKGLVREVKKRFMFTMFIIV